MSKIVCLFKGHEFRFTDATCNGIPYSGSPNILEFVEYSATGKCRRCGEEIQTSGRARVAYWGSPCGPVLASTPSWIDEDEENIRAIKGAIRKYLSREKDSMVSVNG
jgi:hypothetical protein